MMTDTQRQKQKAETATMPVIIPEEEQTRREPLPQVVDQVGKSVAHWGTGTIDSREVPESHLDANHCAEDPSTSSKVVMPGTREEAEELIFASQESGSSLKRALSGLWKFLKKIVGLGSSRDLIKVDPLSGKDHCFTRVEYVSRWGLVEFGVTCPKCEAVAAGPGQFKRVWNTADGEAVTCPECKSTLLASPTTEKDEHLLPYSTKLHAFSRKRHPWSPYTTQQAADIRETLAARLKRDPFDAIEKETADAAQEKSA